MPHSGCSALHGVNTNKKKKKKITVSKISDVIHDFEFEK